MLGKLPRQDRRREAGAPPHHSWEGCSSQEGEGPFPRGPRKTLWPWPWPCPERAPGLGICSAVSAPGPPLVPEPGVGGRGLTLPSGACSPTRPRAGLCPLGPHTQPSESAAAGVGGALPGSAFSLLARAHPHFPGQEEGRPSGAGGNKFQSQAALTFGLGHPIRFIPMQMCKAVACLPG